jgi:hypothetical protein
MHGMYVEIRKMIMQSWRYLVQSLCSNDFAILYGQHVGDKVRVVHEMHANLGLR